MKKLLALMLSCVMIIASGTTAFAATNYQDVITMTEPGAEESRIDAPISKHMFTPESNNAASPRATIVISNVSDPVRYNLFSALTTYSAGPSNITYSKGRSVTISASVTGGGGISVDILQAQIEGTIGASVTFTASEEVSYEVPAGYKGRIVLRYSQDRYTYKVTKDGKTYDGAAYTAAYDEYYARQLISL
ncbi:hypothetical protein QMP26_30475 [Enterocloster clostridioformis]|uniref:hypothetical protein n=1 Tax=Enterocloster clostridioformis TaxID=1531 RepID=UPI0026767919|nr:hypothetical protein [Enterocloster clostridioformis]